MARYYRKRYTRVVKPKKKWASNVKVITNEPIAAGQFFVLVENSVQTVSPTPTIVKCGNFKVSLDCVMNFSSAVSTNPVAMAFILYLPEGWPNSDIANAVTAHPEWIMASKTVGGSVTSGSVFSLETLNMSSRLKRNLNSGDRVLLFFSLSSTSATGITMTGTVRYWTCAN